MLIRKITLKNFQAHKNLTLDLDEFTALVGPSSAGKSAVLRAMAWLFYGEWDKTYPNDLELDTAVAIQLDNGTIWGRFRKGARNWAMCRKPGEKPLTYQDFGEFVPGLLEELNLRPIKLNNDKVNLNFSMQDDPIFMVHESKPAKAQWIGRLYGAHILNQMLRLMSKDKRAIESEKRTAEEEAERLQSELAKYAGLEEQAAAIGRVGELLDRLQALLDCQERMAVILQDREAIKKGAWMFTVDTDGTRQEIARLELLRAVQEARTSIVREELTLEQFSHLTGADTASIRADITALAATTAKMTEYYGLSKELEDVGVALARAERNLAEAGPRAEALRGAIKEALFAEGRCPLCQSKPKKLDMDAVTTNLKTLINA